MQAQNERYNKRQYACQLNHWAEQRALLGSDEIVADGNSPPNMPPVAACAPPKPVKEGVLPAVAPNAGAELVAPNAGVAPKPVAAAGAPQDTPNAGAGVAPNPPAADAPKAGVLPGAPNAAQQEHHACVTAQDQCHAGYPAQRTDLAAPGVPPKENPGPED